MPQITITWTVTDNTLALLDHLVAAQNAEAADAYQRKVAAAQLSDPPFDPGPEPTPETRDGFIIRIGLKTLHGEVVRLRAALRERNMTAVMAAYDDQTISDASKATALDAVGLTFEGLQVVKKR